MNHPYTLGHHLLKHLDHAKYLGVTWCTIQKADRYMNFLRAEPRLDESSTSLMLR